MNLKDKIISWYEENGVLPRYFYRDWWVYIFSDLRGFLKYGDGWKQVLQVIFCRIRNHPYPLVWCSSVFEPDTTCSNCGDETQRG